MICAFCGGDIYVAPLQCCGMYFHEEPCYEAHAAERHGGEDE